MNKYELELLYIIETQIKQYQLSQPLFIRVDYFNNPEIYLKIANELVKRHPNVGVRVAEESFNIWKSQREDDEVLNILESKSYVCNGERLTKLRNDFGDSKNSYVLLATENVQDKAGLADFYVITPKDIEKSLKGNYAKWFPIIDSETDKNILNNLFSSIFSYVPLDLLEVSLIAEISEKNNHTDVEELIEYIFKNLWMHFGIPAICNVNPEIRRQLSTGKKIKLLDNAVKFINRDDYKSGLTKAKKRQLENKFEKFEDDDKFAEVETEIVNYFGSYEEFKIALISFAQGESLDILREKLGRFNFATTALILGLKKESPESTKDKVIKISGSPMKAFAAMILYFLNQNKNKIDEPKLIIDINTVSLADAIIEEEQNKRWNEICIALGGFVDYLNDGLASVELKYNHEDYFSTRAFNTSFVEFEGANKLSKIELTIYLEDNTKIKQKFQWTFSPYEYWLQTFHLFPYFNDVVKENNNEVLPIFTCSQIGNLLTSVDVETFHYQIKSYEINVVNYLEELKELKQLQSNIFTKSYSLAEPFAKLVREMSEYGFYYTINARKSTLLSKFNDHYKEVLTALYENFDSYSPVEKEYLLSITNLFSIVSDTNNIKSISKVKGAIIPPYHPAMFEKIEAQQVYRRQGLDEIIEENFSSERSSYSSLMTKFENIIQQSIIISGVDTILTSDNLSRVPNKVLGYYALHGKSDDAIIDSSSLININIQQDSDIDSTTMSAKSAIILDHINEYMKIFPSITDSLSLAFVSFDYLHPIIEVVKSYSVNQSEGIRKTKFSIYILSEEIDYKSQNYMRLWLENNYTEDDQFNVEIYFNTFKDIKTKNEIFDLVFIENLMEPTEIKYSMIEGRKIKPSETKFPMVFNPMSNIRKDGTRHVSVSQMQFEASFAHSQLVFWLENETSRKDRVYNVEKVLKLRKQIKELLEYYHEHARWVVSIDTGLDKSIYNEENIISFATGEGAYGELNVAISTSETMKNDIAYRLKNRLRKLFPSWDNELYSIASDYAFNQSKILDGIKVLKALNPNDYEIHSFLASILTLDSLDVRNIDEDVILQSLISLDSYNHWFKEEPNRPDFLQLRVKRIDNSNEKLIIYANLIECKMGKESVSHVEKGITQLTNGLQFLKGIFSPESEQYDRRYWYAQLYRLLAFSPIYITEDINQRELLNYCLLKILNAEFDIVWDSTLLTYWLDHNNEVISENQISLNDNVSLATHKAYGQIYVQKHLLPNEKRDQVVYDIDTNNEIQDFADDEETFNVMLKEKISKQDFEQVQPVIDTNVDTESTSIDNENPIKQNINLSDLGKTISLIERAAETEDKDNYIFTPNDMGNNLTSSRETNPEIEENESTKEVGVKSLKGIRVLLGEDYRTGRKIYWEYGHPKLGNRHILISGKSGVGKTYFMQCLLLELARNNISSLIFDYTDGFKKSKLEPEFKEELGDRVVQFHVQKSGFPINPFKKNLKELDEDEYVEESDVDVAERIKSVFTAVYKGMGPQQSSAIYKATLNGLRKYGNAMSLEFLRSELEQSDNGSAGTVLSKIEPLLDRKPFDTTSEYNWEEHRKKEGIVFVVQLSGFAREVQLIITEFILWDLWNFNLSHGTVQKPFPVILDEAQNLDHSETSPSAKILTEGRKFGWSGWYATQFMEGQMSKDEILRLQNASQRVYFAPPDSEVTSIASFLSQDPLEKKEWVNKLSKLGKGQCVVSGPTLMENGELKYSKPQIINVTPLAKRKE